MNHLIFLIIAFPLLGGVSLIAMSRRVREPLAGWIGTAAVGLSFLTTVGVFITLLGSKSGGPSHAVTQHLFDWINVGSLHANMDLTVDPLSITMCLFVTGISTLIHLYSIGYMHGEKDFTKFFIYLNLFVASMLILVLGGNMLLTFTGWEGVGVCSYWLVSYYFQKDSAASAGKKAFIYNRVADVGFLLAMFVIFFNEHTLTYAKMTAHMSSLTLTMAVLALLFAAAGKSAQIPLFNWLPDAMEGPTPVSALIHAATMVTAGVYLLCRMHVVVSASPTGQWVICGIGLATAFVAATIATSQSDIKKGLAFSTVSQIGYMVLAVGTGDYVAAMFLMVAHAFFKALLFLGSGSVIHALDGEQEMGRMGGLRKYLPWTYGTFLFGWLAIVGVPPFAGFWAKGSVLDAVFGKSPWLWAGGLFTALLTAYYMSRLFYLTFTGAARFTETGPNGEAAVAHPHESPWTMRLPLVILAFCSIFGGLLNLPWVHGFGLEAFLSPVFGSSLVVPADSVTKQFLLADADAFVAVLGLSIAWVLWRGRSERPELTPAFLAKVWYWDNFYDTIIGRPATALANFTAEVVDPLVLDGAVDGTAAAVGGLATRLRKVHNGQVRSYGVGIIFGLLVILVSFLVVVG